MDIINHFHWISIEGKRPNIPENFIREESKVILPSVQKEIQSSSHDVPVVNVNTSTNQTAQKTKIVPLVIHNISKELQIFLENFEQRFRKEIKNVKLCPNTNFIMSKELEISLNVIENEPGVVELLPYIIELLMTNMSNKLYLKDPKVHMITLHYLDSILKNPYFYLETYLHQFITVSLSLILMEYTGDQIETSIAVKDFAIKIMKQIYIRYDIRYPNFINQLLDLYKVNILPKENMNNYMTVYGAIKAINSLGPLHALEIILPKIGEIFNNITVISTDGIQVSLKNFVEQTEKNISKQIESNSQSKLTFSIPQFLTIPLSHSIFSDISNINSINNNFEKKLEDENKLINNLITSYNINQNILRKAFYAYYALKESATLIQTYASELEPNLAKPIFQKLNEVFGESLIPNLLTSENETNGIGLDLII
jgi:hypothetical protein